MTNGIKRYVGMLSNSIDREMFKLFCKKDKCITPKYRDCRWCEQVIKEKI